jgi:hypothetical protein
MAVFVNAKWGVYACSVWGPTRLMAKLRATRAVVQYRLTGRFVG